jgi:hypothetical protein
VPFDFFLNIQFHYRKAIIDWKWVRGLDVEEIGVQVEGIPKAVGRIDAHYEGSVVKLGKFHACRSSQASLSNAALTSE